MNWLTTPNGRGYAPRAPAPLPTVSADALLAARELVLARVREDSRFLLAAHDGLDGDAIGSLIALHGLLSALGKRSSILIGPDDLPLPTQYRFLPPDGITSQPPPDISEWTVVLLDCGSIERNATPALRQGKHLLNIDHHHDNTRFAAVNYVNKDASCTAEIIWDLLHELQATLTPAIAQALYVALITDTGRFMYTNTSPTAHLMAAELLQAGVDVPALYRQVYEQQPLRRLTLLGIALGQIQRFDGGQLTLAVLSAADFDRAEANDSDSEGIIDELRAIKGTKVAVLAREDRDGEHKVSLRSTDGDVDVSEIARALGGGGHRRAAGFTTTLTPAELTAFLRQQIAAQLHGATDRAYVAV